MTLKEKFKKNGTLMPFLLPAIIVAIIFSYVPMTGIIIAFKEKLYLLGGDSPIDVILQTGWTLDNFKVLFSGDEFPRALKNTLLISLLKIVVIFPLPIIVALFVVEIKNKVSNKFIQAIMYLPHFLAWSVVSGIFINVFKANGIVNTALINLGIMPGGAEQVMWYKDHFLGMILFTEAWHTVGWSTIIYISSILAISPDLYEAAKIDGASKVRQIFFITLPLIKGTIATMLIMRLCYIMDAGFDQIFTMQHNLTDPRQWEIIGTYVYRMSLNADYTFGAAAGLFNSIVALTMILLGNIIVKKISGKGII